MAAAAVVARAEPADSALGSVVRAVPRQAAAHPATVVRPAMVVRPDLVETVLRTAAAVPAIPVAAVVSGVAAPEVKAVSGAEAPAVGVVGALVQDPTAWVMVAFPAGAGPIHRPGLGLG